MVGVLVRDVLVAIRCCGHCSWLVLRDVLLLCFEEFDLQTLETYLQTALSLKPLV